MSMKFKPGYSMWVLGASFLHNYMAIFDYDNMRVGLYGVSEKETVPWTVIEYLILFSLGLLGLTLVFVIANLCWGKSSKTSGDDAFFS